METLYITSKFIGQESLESRPEEDFGFDYEEENTYEFIGVLHYLKTDDGIVNIVKLIAELNKLKDKGANYVGCDWHCDHQELDLYAFNLYVSTSDEVQTEINSLNLMKIAKKEKLIAELEENLKILKKDLGIQK